VHRLRLLLLRLPVRAPQYPQDGAFGLRGKMDKCTFCAGGPEKDFSEAEFKKYGRNRLAEGKLPACAEMCFTKALVGGDADVVADIYRQRVHGARQGRRSLGLGHGLRQARAEGCPQPGGKVVRKLIAAALGGPDAGARRVRREDSVTVYEPACTKASSTPSRGTNEQFKGNQRMGAMRSRRAAPGCGAAFCSGLP